METGKKQLRLIIDYEDFLRELIDAYNKTYKTDFHFVECVRDEVNFAIVEYSNASAEDIFALGRMYGRRSEAFDKKSSTPL